VGVEPGQDVAAPLPEGPSESGASIWKLAVDRARQRRGVASMLGRQALAVAGRVAAGTGALLVVALSDVEQVDEQWCVVRVPSVGWPPWVGLSAAPRRPSLHGRRRTSLREVN
jgi:GNAT superfamily N-acetyltransferase